MPTTTIREAINQTLFQEMSRDENVIVMGEDVAGGAGAEGIDDAYGGVFGVTKGLMPEFGRERVIDTPISESAFVGAAAGAAMTGLRPVVDLMFVDFLGVCFDQLYNQAAKFRYMFGGKAKTPMVLRAMIGGGLRGAAQHSQTLHNMVTMVPGLKVVMPSNAYDAKGLLAQAVRDDDPVVYLEHKCLYDDACEVPDDEFLIDFGEANFTREGDDVTVVALSAAVKTANAVADQLASKGVSVEVVDPRTTSPLDEEAILESVENTGRLVIIDEAPPRCSVARDIAAIVADKGFSDLRAPIKTVTCPHTPVPFAPNLEDLYLPSEARLAAAINEVLEQSK
ncbi:MAG: alpha-ketoacid dehydrogenase subunit beta [Pseudomonadales bacterium]|nr:alpha-ketoacid dehydrogenase subunit beta [Pseudomonadales bacterium]